MDVLYKAALVQTRGEALAEELVQETYLHVLQAVAKGAAVDNPKAYLFSVLRNRFFMHLRKKYRFSTVYFGDMPQDIPDEADFGALERSEDAKAVRRALAFLSHTYREVMVRYYMKGESVEQIAAGLSIPKGTVLSRLNAGRKKMKEGFENMDAYLVTE
jgi:RNA polymerase sigma-70 factor (ECF subfamily)